MMYYHNRSLEQVIHGVLKFCRHVGETKGHYGELVMSIMCVECRFPDVLFPDLDLMISDSQIKFGENGSTMQFIDQLIYGGNGKMITNSGRVQGTIIYAKPPCSVILLD